MIFSVKDFLDVKIERKLESAKDTIEREKGDFFFYKSSISSGKVLRIN